MSGRTWPVRLLGLAHLGWAATCLARPELLARAADSPDAAAGGTTFVRILGARHLAAGVGLVTVARDWSADVSAGVDAIHAATMVGLALDDRRERTAGLVNAALAAGWFGLARLAARATA